MTDYYVSYLERDIASCKESIKNYKKMIHGYKQIKKDSVEAVKKYKKENNFYYYNYYQDRVRHDRETITYYENLLKDCETQLTKMQIKYFAESGKRFSVIQGGLCDQENIVVNLTK
jgi:hypothetical protein